MRAALVFMLTEQSCTQRWYMNTARARARNSVGAAIGVQAAISGHFCRIILYHAFQKFIQNSATRFISCNFTRNSNTTRLRTAAPNRGTETWLELEAWPFVALRGGR
eukprot:COSAG03_NODE_137_length_11785_cov_19.757827_10_plen_107_part_00